MVTYAESPWTFFIFFCGMFSVSVAKRSECFGWNIRARLGQRKTFHSFYFVKFSCVISRHEFLLRFWFGISFVSKYFFWLRVLIKRKTVFFLVISLQYSPQYSSFCLLSHIIYYFFRSFSFLLFAIFLFSYISLEKWMCNFFFLSMCLFTHSYQIFSHFFFRVYLFSVFFTFLF